MVTKRHPQRYRRKYSSINKQSNSDSSIKVDEPDIANEIPLPNENEESSSPRIQEPKRPSFLDVFKTRIHLDEIILVGLIFLLLDEQLEDDILLILLVYVLLTGKE